MLSNNLVLAGLALSSVTIAATIPEPRDYPTHGAKAVYTLSNDANDNSVHAFPVGKDGTLGQGRVTSTGGKGPQLSMGDPLFSQGSIQRSGNRLLAVNAGSNTLSMFAIDERNPLKLKLMGKPVDTMGDYPNSIAVSDKVKDVVCVSNTGTRSGVACFRMCDDGLDAMDRTLRPLPLNPTQSNPPKGPFNTVSQILFNDEGTQLWALVKGNPMDKTQNNTGYFGSFAVQRGEVSQQLTHSSPAGTAVLFGSVALPGNKVFATDASFGVAALQVSSSGMANTINKYTIPGQKATCWSTVSPATGLAYAPDGGLNRIAAFDPSTATPKAISTFTNGNPGMLEIVPSGSMLYSVSPGNSSVAPAIVVMQTNGASGKVTAVQNFHPKGVTTNMEGLAVY